MIQQTETKRVFVIQKKIGVVILILDKVDFK